MLLNGVSLTIVGMVVVFIFLALLVLVMKLLFLLVKKLSPDSLTEKPQKGKEGLEKRGPAQTTAAGDQDQAAPMPEIAVAIAAVTAHITARG